MADGEDLVTGQAEAVERVEYPKDDWRAGLSAGKQDKLRMLEHGINSDCVLIVGPENGETQEFRAHRLYLTCASPVFEKMFASDTSEAKTGRVRISDIEPHIFNRLLIYAYVDLAELGQRYTFENANSLALAADKYQMSFLFDDCIKWMCDNMRPNYVWGSLVTARMLENTKLMNACMKILQDKTMYCLKSEDFLDTDEVNMMLLLRLNEQNVDSEMVLVTATVNWARHEAQKRGLAGDDAGVRAVLEPRLLKLMRLLSLSPDEFAIGPGLSEWLTDEEKEWVDDFHKIKPKEVFFSRYISESFLPRSKPIHEPSAANTVYHLSYGVSKSRFHSEYSLPPTLIFKTTLANAKLQSIGIVSAHDLKDILYCENLMLQVLVQRDKSWVNLGRIKYYNEAPSNSTITIDFPRAIHIVGNVWHVLQIKLNKKKDYGLLPYKNLSTYYLTISEQKVGQFEPQYRQFFTSLTFGTCTS